MGAAPSEQALFADRCACATNPEPPCNTVFNEACSDLTGDPTAIRRRHTEVLQGQKRRSAFSFGGERESTMHLNHPSVDIEEAPPPILRRLQLVGERLTGRKLGPDIEFGDAGASKSTVASERMDRAQKQKMMKDDLHHGSMRSDLKRVQRALVSGANVEQADLRGVTPLMHASAASGNQQLEVVTELLDRSALIGTRDQMGWTCFHHACRNGRTEIVNFLIYRRADPSIKTSNDHRTALMLACIEGKRDLTRDLLKHRMVKLQIGDRDHIGFTCLHYAAKEGHMDVVRNLVENHAKVNAKDNEGVQALMLAAERGHFDSVRFLIAKKAEINGRCKEDASTDLLCIGLRGYGSMASKKEIGSICQGPHRGLPNVRCRGVWLMALQVTRFGYEKGEGNC